MVLVHSWDNPTVSTSGTMIEMVVTISYSNLIIMVWDNDDYIGTTIG